MQVAQQSFGNGLGNLDRVLTDRLGLVKAQEQKANEAKVLAFKELVTGADANTLNAMQASGELGLLRRALNNEGRTAVLGLEDNRSQTLLDRQRGDIRFKQGETEFGWKTDQARHQARLRPFEERSKKLDVQVKETNLVQDKERFGWDGKKQAEWEANEENRRKQVAANLAATHASTRNSIDSNSRQNDEHSWRIDTRNRELRNAEAQGLLNQSAKEGNLFSADGELNSNRLPEIMQFMVENKIGKDDSERQAVIRELTPFLTGAAKVKRKNPDTKQTEEIALKNIPMSVVKEGLLKGSSDWFHVTDRDFAEEPVLNIRDALINAAPGLDRQYRDYASLLNRLGQNPVVVPPKKGK